MPVEVMGHTLTRVGEGVGDREPLRLALSDMVALEVTLSVTVSVTELLAVTEVVGVPVTLTLAGSDPVRVTVVL